jgi:threonine/homoserine/homoserine lactone efflux protein
MLSGIAAGLAVAMPLGAIGVLIVELGARAGWQAGAAAGLGTALCDALYATLAVVAGRAIASALDPVQQALTLAAAALLAAIGAWMVLSPLRRVEPGPLPPAHHLTLRFLALTAVNPLTAVIFAGLIAGDPDRAAGAAFVAGVFVASLAWQWALAGFGAILHHRLPAAAQRWTRVVGGGVVVALAVATGLSR